MLEFREFSSIATYIAYGFSFIAGLIPFVWSGHLWKPIFFKKCLVAAIVSGMAGLILEVTNLLRQKTGMTLVVMFVPLIFLGYFQMFRWCFKRRYKTEPYFTSVSSVVGAPPLDLFTSENKDGKKRKFQKDRTIMSADFVFSLGQGLITIFTIFALLELVLELNK